MKVNKLPISSFLCCVVAVFGFACGQDYNSNSGDRPVTVADFDQDICESEAGARFCAARTIYQQRCFSCHPSWSGLNSEQAWVDAGLVVPGNRNASPAINRLINSGSNMPLGGSALPSSEYQTLINWVEMMSVN